MRSCGVSTARIHHSEGLSVAFVHVVNAVAVCESHLRLIQEVTAFALSLPEVSDALILVCPASCLHAAEPLFQKRAAVVQGKEEAPDSLPEGEEAEEEKGTSV